MSARSRSGAPGCTVRLRSIRRPEEVQSLVGCPARMSFVGHPVSAMRHDGATAARRGKAARRPRKVTRWNGVRSRLLACMSRLWTRLPARGYHSTMARRMTTVRQRLPSVVGLPVQTRRNPVESRARILRAAEECFAESGYEGARMQAIANRARINKRMLYHYFGSKQGLYAAVLDRNFEQILRPACDAGREALAAGGPRAAIRAIVRTYYDALRDHPRYVRLLLWEAARQWSHANAAPHHQLAELRDIIQSVLHLGIARREFDPDIPASISWSLVIGVPAMFFFYRPRLEHLLDDETVRSELLDIAWRELVRFVEGGLLPRGEAQSPPPGVEAAIEGSGRDGTGSPTS